MKRITLYPGFDKNGIIEDFEFLTFEKGNIYSIIGDTGSGKSRLIKDIEQLVCNDSLTNRKVCVDDEIISLEDRYILSVNLVSHLSQNMRFVLDSTVEEFLIAHLECRNNTKVSVNDILKTANTITSEPINLKSDLTTLSGGQTRALMIADIALVSDNPIVLIDEIENAGINKSIALSLLLKSDKLIFIVTHDPHTALLSEKRLIMKNGAIFKVLNRTDNEIETLNKLENMYRFQLKCQEKLRKGESLYENC